MSKITVINKIQLIHVSGCRVRNLGFKEPSVLWRNGLKASWTRLFLIFWPNFLPYLRNFQYGVMNRRCCETLKNHQIWQKFGKKWRKSLFNLPTTHFSADSGYSKIGILSRIYLCNNPLISIFFFNIIYKSPIFSK